mmetsp:Transcript_14808/g.22301  ORF Transcript_14808/g.22301 Transcript_14808/m.22301 type:complete len:239 (+) Transcript_14808:71-787(+)
MSWEGDDRDTNPFASRQQHNNPLLGAHANSSSESPEWLEDPQAAGGDAGPTDPEVPKMIFYTRIINLVLSICMLLASLLSLVTTESITTGVLACYVVVMSCLLCCYETHLKQVSKVIALNFGFLFSAKSRCIFMVFVASLLFSFSLFGKLIGCAMLANAALNVYVIVKHPTFEDAQRQSAQKDISDFLAAHPGLAKQAMAMGVQAGSDFARENPEMARQGAETVVRESMNSKGTYVQV